MGDVEARSEVMTRVARDAAARGLAFWRRRAELVIEEKADPRDIVSRADREVETAIRHAISTAFPDDGFLGEELGAEFGRSAFTWVIDPIDGTAPFLAGQPNWCVSIALVEAGRTVAGAISLPVTDELLTVRRGAGAWSGGNRLALDPRVGIASGMTGLGASHRTDPAHAAAAVERLMRRGGMYFRNGSGVMMLAYVATGRLVGYFEPHMWPWDCLAGLLMIEEAGGRVGPFPAGRLEDGGRVIAAAPGAWDDLAAIAEGL